MDRTIFLRKASFDNASLIKRSAILCAIWLLVSLIISFARITQPAFGIQGELPIHYHIARSYAVKARIETYNYPHWVVRLDGREIKIEVESGTGLMLDQNEHSSYFPNQ